MQAPDFSLQDQSGQTHNLAEYKGRWLVLYFYPKDDTPGCTVEACSFRDNLSAFTDKGVSVLGVSKDTLRSHQKFAGKFALNFPILSDVSLATIKAYNSWGKKKFMGREFDGVLRTTVLINPEGAILKRYENVTPKDHIKEILADIETHVS